MASLKRASRQRLREIEFDARGSLTDIRGAARLTFRHCLKDIEHEKFNRGEEL